MTMHLTRTPQTLLVETVREFLIIDSNVKGAYLHAGKPTLDIFYRDCDYAMTLHFESVEDAQEAFDAVKLYVKEAAKL